MDNVDRDRMAAELATQGFIAQPRNWALGKTIFVSHPRFADRADDITVYRDGLHLRFEEGRWRVTELSLPGHPEPHASLATWDDVFLYLRQRFIEGRPPVVMSECSRPRRDE
jgi:hypothetical protein